MSATPAYELQPRAAQRKALANAGQWFVWILTLETNANRAGILERLASPAEWPWPGYLPYVEARGSMREPALMLLLLEVESIFPGLAIQPYLLPRAELDFLAEMYQVYAWPDLRVDKVCPGCGAVWPARYDEEGRCCNLGLF